MNIKLLASIAVSVLLMAVVSVSITQSAYAEETKTKAKALKEETKAKTKALKEETKTKAKALKEETKAKTKALKEETKTKAKALKEETKAKTKALKEETKATITSSSTIEMAKGSATPGCETTSSCYLPNAVTVKTGTKVTWKNVDSAAHTVTSGKDAIPDGNFDSGIIMAGKSFSHTFKSAGTYNYYCIVHPWMTGSVTAN
ncbi:MAG: plastocyanin/azurin family copper-binding protein [Candidatus Nitrosotenuis sp.]